MPPWTRSPVSDAPGHLLAALAALQLATGELLWLAPGFFHEQIGPFGPRNNHYMGDPATWYLALGVLLLVTLRRPAWRRPVLALALVQYALHAANHLLDVGEASPERLGPATLVATVLERGAPGVYNIVDDEPAPLREWLPVYAEAIGARRPLRAPVWLARLAAGPTAVLLVRQPGAANAMALRELDWQPRWRTWREGFREAPR